MLTFAIEFLVFWKSGGNVQGLIERGLFLLDPQVLGKLSEGDQQSLKEMLAKLQKIAFNAKAETAQAEVNSPLKSCTADFLVTRLDALIEQKRLQYNQFRKMKWLYSKSLGSPLARCNVDPEELFLSLSEIIDKSVRSLGGGQGFVRVTIKVTLSELQFSVEDNGWGLNEDLARRMGKGSDLMEHSRKRWLQWGGDLHVASKLGAGSRVDLFVPRSDVLQKSNSISEIHANRE